MEKKKKVYNSGYCLGVYGVGLHVCFELCCYVFIAVVQLTLAKKK
jgi:hypothetical protein